MSIVIEDKIPVPKERPNFRQYLQKLTVGQSFRVEIEDASQLRNAVNNMNKRNKDKKHFVVRKVTEKIFPKSKRNSQEKEFVRVWRDK